MSNIRHKIHGLTRDIGFPVRRLLPAAAARTVGPFVFFDHMGPVEFDAGTTEGDVRPHPHIGLATVTYLFSGAMMHRDSLGVVQRITPGAVNWMAAGRGIVHSERIPDDIREQKVPVHGLQMWVALPADQEDGAPLFHHYAADEMPDTVVGGARLHVLAGSAFGVSSPVQTASPTLYVAGSTTDGATLEIAAEVQERAVYVVRGEVSLDGERLEAGTLAILEPGAAVTLQAEGETVFMILGGAPLDGPRFVWWNFVSTSRDKIEAAKQAWNARDKSVFPDIPGESEWIPLPTH
ncbi:pirin family protein [Herbaspirillum seropedicae]|uniref:Pirin-like protein n=1 Tax=Herbaspirillum seropedicae (strain SmR1) TaxID=757424 RepID=D8IWL0_HERSS|nr:pirin family protein [Herbaspirillum seropedicae]ADJ64030.1 pirin-like protein [Herbaspirillum seropedicae SmR1]AKN65997.1 pirin [Herbaspirillum seropedicae]MDR6394087.1 redox-sensitive bicupin YhaK (pirin superfamily) [Herbaspirillum seropedicae]NQE29142.1 pirin [Herbaspirillum seropedicae]UMU21985.1 pirin family protein [Herbaspirillum seropedicae]